MDYANVEILSKQMYSYEDGCYESVDCKIVATINGIQKTYHEFENFKSDIEGMKLSDAVLAMLKQIEEEIKKWTEEINDPNNKIFSDDDDW